MAEPWEDDAELPAEWDEEDAPWEISDDEGENSGAPTRIEATVEFVDMLVHLYLSGSMAAKSLAILCHWAHHAGVGGSAASLAMPPGRQTGKYKKHVDSALGLDARDAAFYEIDVPGHSKHDVGRIIHKMRAQPPHEVLHAEIVSNPELHERLSQATTEEVWAPVYHDHPVVAAAGANEVFPVAVYLDGVPYTKQDSFLGVYCYNLVSGKRHLTAILRKRLMCRCGCKGWCSMWPLFHFLHWSLSSLASGVFPARRHDGGEWRNSDERRASLAGLATSVRGAVVFWKGDWAEFCLSMGFPVWSHNTHPCLFCTASRAQLYEFSGATPLHMPSPLKTHADYVAECERVEHERSLTREQYDLVTARLQFDKRRAGHRGLALMSDIPSLGLVAGDRIDPCPQLPDVMQFFSIREFPVSIVFWRTSDNPAILRRNPVFDQALGITVESLTIDVLHTLNLGVYKIFTVRVFWALLSADVWGVAAGRTQEVRTQLGTMCLKNDMVSFYRRYRAEHPERSLTEMQTLTPSMLGTATRPRLQSKAAETKGLLLFTHDMLLKHSAGIDRGSAFLKASGHLIRLLHLMETSPVILSQSVVQDSIADRRVDYFPRVLSCFMGFGCGKESKRPYQDNERATKTEEDGERATGGGWAEARETGRRNRRETQQRERRTEDGGAGEQWRVFRHNPQIMAAWVWQERFT